MPFDIKEFMVKRDGKDYVLYAGLLGLAHERGLRNITTTLIATPSDLNGQTAIVFATVETEAGTFSGIGDASPGNVTRMLAPHLIRMAETRAKARALRDAVNVGVTALEELGDDAPAPAPARATQGGDWPRDGRGATRPAQTAPTGPVEAHSAPAEGKAERRPCKRCGETIEVVAEGGQVLAFNVGADGERSRVLHASTCVAAQAEPGR